MYLVNYEMHSENLKFDVNTSLPSPDLRPKREPTSQSSESEKKDCALLKSS